MKSAGDYLWKSLRQGDFIRLTDYPLEFLKTGYQIHPTTVRLFKKLIQRRRPMRIHEIDDDGLPWVWVRFRRRSGGWVHHAVAMNNTGIVRVRHRNKDKTKL
jgi:hypothetical protein